MSKNKLKLIALILLILNVVMGFLTFYNPDEKIDTRVFADVPDEVISPALPSPTSIPEAFVTTTEMPSIDGKATLVLKKTTQGSEIEYSIATIDTDGELVEVMSEIVTDVEYTLPFNSWSPDNTYFFIEKRSPTGLENLVFRADGETIREDEKSINATTVFYEKIEEMTIEEITGWASPTLLIANTVSTQNDTRVSYWIEIPSKAVIRLGTYFE